MRKYLLLLLMSLPFVLFAQDGYHPLVEPGKKWTYRYNALLEYVWDYYYTLEGDTTIAGKNCLKMYSDNKDNNGEICYKGALFEENKKVYCFYPDENEANLLYDFDCKVGDTLKIRNIDLITLSIDTIVGIICKGEQYVFQAQLPDENDEPFVMGIVSWIEGVGATKDFFRMLPLAGNYNSLVACELNGEMLYQSSTAIQSVRSHQSDDNGAIFDLQGRRLSSPTKGINIIRQSDGTTKKVIVK